MRISLSQTIGPQGPTLHGPGLVFSLAKQVDSVRFGPRYYASMPSVSSTARKAGQSEIPTADRGNRSGLSHWFGVLVAMGDAGTVCEDGCDEGLSREEEVTMGLASKDRNLSRGVSKGVLGEGRVDTRASGLGEGLSSDKDVTEAPINVTGDCPEGTACPEPSVPLGCKMDRGLGSSDCDLSDGEEEMPIVGYLAVVPFVDPATKFPVLVVANEEIMGGEFQSVRNKEEDTVSRDLDATKS